MADGIDPDVLYVVDDGNDRTSYATTPDGVGMYWYDTREEAISESLFLPENPTEHHLTHKQLEIRRGNA